MARYARLILAPTKGFGLWQRLFMPEGLIMLFLPILGNFGCLVVPLVTLINKQYIYIFKSKNANNPKKIQKISNKLCKKCPNMGTRKLAVCADSSTIAKQLKTVKWLKTDKRFKTVKRLNR